MKLFGGRPVTGKWVSVKAQTAVLLPLKRPKRPNVRRRITFYCGTAKELQESCSAEDRQTVIDRQTQTDTDRHRQTQTDTDRHKQTLIQRDKQRQTRSQKPRSWLKQRD